MSYSDRPDIVDIIKERVAGLTVQLERVDYNGSVSLFVVSFNDETQLANNWDRVSSFIGAYYQSNLKTEYERWNVYILYIIGQKIQQGLKYKIENNRFSSRKIVIDGYTKVIDDINIKLLIEEHITNVDLSLTSSTVLVAQREYKSKSPIWKIIKSGKIKAGKGSKLESEKLMSQIIKALK